MELHLDFISSLILFAATFGVTVFGLRQLSWALQVIFEKPVQKLVNRLGYNNFLGWAIGFALSFLIQSQQSSSLMALSYARSGLLHRKQLVSLLLGSGMGIMLVFGVILLPLDALTAFCVAGLSLLPVVGSKRPFVTAMGRLGFSLATILGGYMVMRMATFSAFLAPELNGTTAGFYDFLMGLPLLLQVLVLSVPLLAVSYFVRSPVTLIVSIIAVASVGVLPYTPLVAGLFAAALLQPLIVFRVSLKLGTVAKRGALGVLLTHLLMVVLLAVTFSSWGRYLFGHLSRMPHQIGLMFVFMVYQVCVGGLGLLIMRPMARLTEKLCRPPAKKESQKLLYIGLPGRGSSILGMEQAFQEVKKMAALVESTMSLSVSYLEEQNADVFNKVVKYEQISDSIRTEIFDFISIMLQGALTSRQARQARSLMRMTNELESVADRCRSIVEAQKEIINLGFTLEGTVYDELKQMMVLLLGLYEEVFLLITDQQEEGGPPFRVRASQYDQKHQALRKRYMQWLRSEAGSQYEWEAALRYEDVLQDLWQIRKRTMNIFEVFTIYYK